MSSVPRADSHDKPVCPVDIPDKGDDHGAISDLHGKSGSALWDCGSNLRFWPVVVLGFAADYLTKRWAVAALAGPDQVFDIIPGWFSFVLRENPGAAWSIGAGKTGLLLTVSVVAILFILWMFYSSSPRQKLTHISLGLLLSGALGNIYDRIFNDGKVIDFIEVNLHFRFCDPWPTFNIADSLLSIGVVLLMLGILRTSQKS